MTRFCFRWMVWLALLAAGLLQAQSTSPDWNWRTPLPPGNDFQPVTHGVALVEV